MSILFFLVGRQSATHDIPSLLHSDRSFQPCLTRAFDVVCAREQDYSRCKKAGPEELVSRLATDSQLTEEVQRARRLVGQSDVVSIGSSSDTSNGFCDQVLKGKTVCTDRKELDLFEFSSWLQLFGGPVSKPPGVIFAEHVIEHFSPTQVHYLVAAAFLTMKPGGVFRVAVPDGYKPSPSYQQYVRAGSTASGLGNHHIVAYTIDNLVPIFRSVGFEINEHEHFDAEGKFHSQERAYAYDEVYGKVMRSWKHDTRNNDGVPLPWNSSLGNLEDDLEDGEPLYTSLWFDAVKPEICANIFGN